MKSLSVKKAAAFYWNQALKSAELCLNNDKIAAEQIKKNELIETGAAMVENVGYKRNVSQTVWISWKTISRIVM